MNFIRTQLRFQMKFGSLEDKIENDNPVRVVDCFVERLDLNKLGFIAITTQYETQKLKLKMSA